MPRKRLTIDLTGLKRAIETARPDDSVWSALSLSAKCRVLINLGLKSLGNGTEQVNETEDEHDE